MILRRLLRAAAVAAIVLAVFIAGVLVGGHPQSSGLNRLAEPMRGWVLGDTGTDLSSQVLQLLRDEYYLDIDDQELQEASVEGLLEALEDPYTAYLDEDQLAALRDHNDGAFVGIGVQVALGDQGIAITRVYPNSPAQRAGIVAGDLIEGVDGAPARAQEFEEVLSAIRGEEGTDVVVSVRTPGAEPREVRMTRERVRIPAVESDVISRDGRSIGYLHLMRFTRGSSEALAERTEQMLAGGVDGLVLDLRRDPGGLVSEALGVAGVFLEDGSEVAVTEGHNAPAACCAPRVTRWPTMRCRWWSWSTATAPARPRSWRERCAMPSGRSWWASRPSARRWCRAPCCCARAEPCV